MKTITLSALLLVATISLSSFVLSNKETRETVTTTAKGPGMLRVHRQGAAISLTWSNSANAVEYRIERSNDGQFFEFVDQVPNSGKRSNNYKDANFFPGVLHYRIVCINEDGTEECSNTDVINVRQR